MVSFFALFTGKKRRKSTARPTSPNGEAQKRSARPSSPTRQRSATRFLSLRSRNAKPYDLQRRQSAEAKRRRSVGTAIVRPEEEAPRLTLGWEGRARTTGLQTKEGSLGLDGVGRPPRLEKTEIKVVREQRWSCEEVMQAWKWFGGSLRDSNLETAGIMLPLRMGQSVETRDLLLALFTLSIRPKLSSSFPSLTDHYPAAPAEHGEVGEDQSAWTERFLQSLKELGNPTDTAEALKFVMRRLSSSPVLPASLDPTSPLKPFLTDEIYTSFVRGERESSYNLQAYELIFLPRLRLGLGAYLDEIFEVWAAIASRGDVNLMGGGRLPLYLGWWIWGSGAKGETRKWAELYGDWKAAGRKVEHLFLAWIRNQSTKQKLPTRLLQLVDRYPFGNEYEENQAPRPPPSTFPRQTLHVSLMTPTPISGRILPSELLQQAMQAEVQGEISVPLFMAIRAPRTTTEEEVQNSQSVDDLIADDSKTFLQQLADGHPPNANTAIKTNGNLPNPPAAEKSLPTPPDNQPLYRPFSMVSQHNLSSRVARRRSQSLGEGDLKQATVDQISPLQALSEEVESLISGSPSRLKKRPSESNIRSSSNGLGNGVWESFEKSGFGNTPEPDLQLSPQTTSLALSPEGDGSISAGFEKIEMPRRKRVPVPPIELPPVITGEEVIQVDDLFIAFVEDAQLDPASDWPQFVLVRLATPLTRDDVKPIEWLLVTVEHHAPPEPVSVDALPKRSISPGAMSTSSRFGSSLGLFRRTSSSTSIRNAGRRSIFSSTHRQEPKHAKSVTNLAPLPESQSIPLKEEADRRPPGSAVSTAPTEYTITDLGDMVKIPSATDDSALHFDPSGDTKAKDWVYRTEGGAHFIFAYRGSSTTYANRILRVRKVVATPVPGEEIRTVWARDLMPKLLSRDLLLRITPVELQEKWLKDLFKAELTKRPRERQDSNPNESLLQSPEKVNTAWIMDDVLGKSRKDETVLCIEIKPKWGSLPSAKHIQPEAAAQIKSQIPRYRLHEHFRDPTSAHGEKYNPLDLYSGEQLRMRKALEGLWAVWESSGGQKNNWKINIDGKTILPGKSSSIPIVGTKKPVQNSTVDLLLPSLISSEVFTLLGNLQSHLDATDISDLAARYKAAYPDSDLFDSANIPEPGAQEIDAFIVKYLSNPGAGAVEDSWSFRERLIAFALAATFKDCSIMVRLPLAKSSGVWQLSSNPDVRIVDTDLKPLGSLRKWYDLDEKLWRHWLAQPPSSAVEAPMTPKIPAPDTKNDLLIRPKAFTSPSAVEGSSVRALYVPTPDRSAPGTPMEQQEEQLAEFPGVSVETPKPKVSGLTLAPIMVPTTTEKQDHEPGQAVPEPTTPQKLSRNAKRGSEAVSLADALSITPSANHFALLGRDPVDDEHDVVHPLQELPIDQNSPLAPHTALRDVETKNYDTSMVDKPIPAIIESSPSNQQDISSAAQAHVPEDPSSEAIPLAERSFTAEPTPEPADSITDSPIIERVTRSLAPSPSPHPEIADTPVIQPSTLPEVPSRDQHLVLPTEVLIMDHPEASQIETLENHVTDHAPTEAATPIERSVSQHDDKANQETETSQSGILGMAGTAAAVSAAAVVGAIGAVAGVAAAAVDIASPTKSTFDENQTAKDGGDESIEEEHAVHAADTAGSRPDDAVDLQPDAVSETPAAKLADPEPVSRQEAHLDEATVPRDSATPGHIEDDADESVPKLAVSGTEHAPTMPGGSEDLIEDSTPDHEEGSQYPPSPLHARTPSPVQAHIPDPAPEAEPLIARQPSPPSLHGDVARDSGVALEVPESDASVAQAGPANPFTAESIEPEVPVTNQFETDDAVPLRIEEGESAISRGEDMHDEAIISEEEPHTESASPFDTQDNGNEVRADTIAFLEPIQPHDSDAVIEPPAREQFSEFASESIPMSAAVDHTGDTSNQKVDIGSPTDAPTDPVDDDAVTGSPKAAKRSTFGQVEEDTAKDLAGIPSEDVLPEGYVDEPVELERPTEPSFGSPTEPIDDSIHLSEMAPVVLPAHEETEPEAVEANMEDVPHGVVLDDDTAMGSGTGDHSEPVAQEADEDAPHAAEQITSPDDISPRSVELVGIDSKASIERAGLDQLSAPFGVAGHPEGDIAEHVPMDQANFVEAQDTVPPESKLGEENLPAMIPAAAVPESTPSAPADPRHDLNNTAAEESGSSVSVVQPLSPVDVSSPENKHDQVDESSMPHIQDQEETQGPAQAAKEVDESFGPDEGKSESPATKQRPASPPHLGMPLAASESPVEDESTPHVAAGQPEEAGVDSPQPQEPIDVVGPPREPMDSSTEPRPLLSSSSHEGEPSPLASPVARSSEDAIVVNKGLDHRDGHLSGASSTEDLNKGIPAEPPFTGEPEEPAGYAGLEQLAADAGATHPQPSDDIAPEHLEPIQSHQQQVTQPFEPSPPQDETPFMTPGSMAPTREFPFDRDIPSRMSSVVADEFETPMEELDTPKLGPQVVRDDDIEGLGSPAHGQEASAGEESFTSDRTFGEDRISSQLSASETEANSESTASILGDTHPVHLGGVPSGLSTAASNQSLVPQEVPLDGLHPAHAPSTTSPAPHDDRPVVHTDAVHPSVPSTPPANPTPLEQHAQRPSGSP